MHARAPRVTVGLPVYNGEKYLAAAIESILNQTFEDFELVISDNASTDQSAEVCRRYAARDGRIRYFRGDVNRGISWNYNRVVGLARGEYFKWAACDDVCAPTFLDRCVEVLDRDDDVVWCYPRTAFIDATGRPGSGPGGEVHSFAATGPESSRARRHASRLFRSDRESHRPHQRFASVLRDPGGVYDRYGLIRMSVLARTGLERPFLGSDKVLAAELSLLGRFVEIPEALMFWRHHDEQSGMQPALEVHRRVSGSWTRRWFLPRRLHCTAWYLRLLLRSPISWAERLRCLAVLVLTAGEPKRWWDVLREMAERLLGSPRALRSHDSLSETSR